MAGGLEVNVGKRGAAGSSCPLSSSQREYIYDGDAMDDTFDTFDRVSQVDRWDRDNTSGYAPLKYEALRMRYFRAWTSREAGIGLIFGRALSNTALCG